LTLMLTALGTSVALGAAILLALLSMRGDAFSRSLARVLMLVGQSAPNFWLAIIFILIFAVTLRWLPPSGVDDWRGLILPALTVAILPAASLARVLRARLREVLAQDYIRTARAKGLRPPQLMWRHVLRNAAIPTLTLLGVQVSALLGGAIISEAVFALPGLGRLTVQAISARDVPLIQAFVFVSTLFVVLVNLALDVLYVWLDPRITLT
ncbi:MAG: ABC transporter permease, partial [Chloroflexi bacterium]|nr:ABC transporter permease [Chloroflexota bacterium]